MAGTSFDLRIRPTPTVVDNGHMVLLSLLLSAIAVPVAAAICFGFSSILRRLGYRSATERITAKDQRWLSRQRPDLRP